MTEKAVAMIVTDSIEATVFFLFLTKCNFLLQNLFAYSSFHYKIDLPAIHKIQMPNLQQKIKEVLFQAQISKGYKGFSYLEYSIYLVIEDESRLSSIFSEVYTKVGERFGATPTAVERDMRTIRDAFWNNGGFEYFKEHCNVILYNRPFVRELIELFAEQVLREMRKEGF